MSLANYRDARTWATAIRDEVLSGRMPPWPAAPGYGDFANDARLSALEADLVARWAEGGAPLGPDVAKPPRDVGLDRAESVRVDLPATRVVGGGVRRVPVALPLDRDRFLTRWAFEPGNRSLVEEARLRVNGRVIGSWTPFDLSVEYPPHMTDRLPKDAQVAVDVRYRRTSEPVDDRSALTLSFDRRPQRQLQHLTLACGSQPIDREIDLIAVQPTAAAAGETVEVVAYDRDGLVAPVAVVSRYRPDYAVTYRLRAPIHLARGSRVDVRSSADGCSARIDFVSR